MIKWLSYGGPQVFDVTASFSVGEIEVTTTDHRGLSVEEVAKRAMDKILHVSKDSPEPIREQALALKETMYEAILFYRILCGPWLRLPSRHGALRPN